MIIMKKAFLTILVTLLLLAIPVQALAVTAQYGTTQAFLNSLDEAGYHYSWLGVDSDNDEHIRLTFEGDYMSDIVTNWYFSEDPQRVGVRVWDIITYSGQNYQNVLETLNNVNSSYRYVCLYADTSDNTVTAKFDMPIRQESCGPMCVEMLERLLNIVDVGYNALKQYDISR